MGRWKKEIEWQTGRPMEKYWLRHGQNTRGEIWDKHDIKTSVHFAACWKMLNPEKPKVYEDDRKKLARNLKRKDWRGQPLPLQSAGSGGDAGGPLKSSKLGRQSPTMEQNPNLGRHSPTQEQVLEGLEEVAEFNAGKPNCRIIYSRDDDGTRYEVLPFQSPHYQSHVLPVPCTYLPFCLSSIITSLLDLIGWKQARNASFFIFDGYYSGIVLWNHSVSPIVTWHSACT